MINDDDCFLLHQHLSMIMPLCFYSRILNVLWLIMAGHGCGAAVAVELLGGWRG